VDSRRRYRCAANVATIRVDTTERTGTIPKQMAKISRDI
jgi:hypothetical protein